MSETISIITPLYNGSETIQDCYDSIKAQSYGEWEWIIVDDGSTDSSLEKVQPWLSDNIKLLHNKKPCGGPAAPRNTGIAASKGNWIALLDQDDIWENDKLQKQMDFVKLHQDLALICGNQKVFGNKKHKRQGEGIIRLGKTFFPDANYIFKHNPFLASTALFSKNACLKVGGFDEHSLAVGRDEWDLWIRISLKYRVAYMDENLGFYRWHEGNLSHSLDHHNTTAYIREKLKPHIDPEVYADTLARDYYNMAKEAYKANQKDRFKQHIKEAQDLRFKYFFKGLSLSLKLLFK